MVIDYSQYKEYLRCPTLWYEKYVRGVQPKRKVPRDDALALGSLVHAGLEQYRLTGAPTIPLEVIAEQEVAPSCLQWAQALLAGYVRWYPELRPGVQYCEEPLKFPLGTDLVGVAKIDNYFQVEQEEQVSLGTSDGATALLSPGWWIREYKTKDASRNTANYIAQWAVNKQVDFQMLALQTKIGEPVQGVIVDVLEKHKPYVPKRQCKQCRQSQNFDQYEIKDGRYECPQCQNLNDFDPPKDQAPPAPNYYRIVERRSASQLAASYSLICQVVDKMQDHIVYGTPTIDNTEFACVDGIFGPCPYFTWHREGRLAEPGEGFVQVKDPLHYIGLNKSSG